MYLYNSWVLKSLSISRSPRKTYQSNPVALLAWYGKNPKVVVAIWKMVRDQHMFYRSKRSAKVTNTHTFMFINVRYT